MKKKISKVIVRIANVAAKSAASSSSPWNFYQPKEPDEIKNVKR